MPPTDYKSAMTVVAATPYGWMKLRALWSRLRLRKNKDAVEGHRVLDEK